MYLADSTSNILHGCITRFLHFCDCCFCFGKRYWKFPISKCMCWLQSLRLDSCKQTNSTKSQNFHTKSQLSTLVSILDEIIYSNHRLIFGFSLISCRGSFLQDKLSHFICHKNKEKFLFFEGVSLLSLVYDLLYELHMCLFCLLERKMYKSFHFGEKGKETYKRCNLNSRTCA